MGEEEEGERPAGKGSEKDWQLGSLGGCDREGVSTYSFSVVAIAAKRLTARQQGIVERAYVSTFKGARLPRGFDSYKERDSAGKSGKWKVESVNVNVNVNVKCEVWSRE